MLEGVGRRAERPEVLYELLAPDVVLDASRLGIPDIGVHHGHDGVREFWRRWLGPWDAWEFAPEEFIDANDEVVVSIRQRGQGKGSGVWAELSHSQVWTFRDGKVVRWAMYQTIDEALRAAGTAREPSD